MKISETAIAGFSNTEEVDAGMIGLDDALVRERQWYGDAERYLTHSDLVTDIIEGDLMRVKSDDHIRINGRFRHDNLELSYQPYLTRSALYMLHRFGQLWRQTVRAHGVPDNVRLAITSMVRSQEYQEELVKAGKFAVADSTHLTGNAFDIDLGGYYLDLEDGREATVSLRPPAKQLEIGKALVKDLGLKGYNPVRLGPEHFRPEVTEAALRVAEGLHHMQVLNRIVEMPETVNRALHIAVAPRWTVRQLSA